jgi:hypothetical protein
LRKNERPAAAERNRLRYLDSGLLGAACRKFGHDLQNDRPGTASQHALARDRAGRKKAAPGKHRMNDEELQIIGISKPPAGETVPTAFQF